MPEESEPADNMSPADRWFREVADYTCDWESWHGPDGRLIWVNPVVERITGFSVAECLKMSDYPLPLIVADDRDRFARVLESARTRTCGENLEFRSLGRNGETRWMSVYWQPMFAKDGIYLGIRTSVRDMTDRRALREQLRLHAEHLEQLVQERTARLRQLELRQRQMEKLAALGQLAAGVAHEINNPLAGVRNAFELIKSSVTPEHEHYELLDLIDREIERISAIIHQMYQLYRRSPQKTSQFSLSNTLCEVIYLLKSAASKREVKFECDLDNSAIEVCLVEGEVKQVLYNLLRNAIHASPTGESVEVQVDEQENEVQVNVCDRGPGISEDVALRIFEPFFTTKQGESESGMGLGLSVSRSLIEAMGGRIDISQRPGGGSIFSAIFPRRIDSQQESADD